MSSARPKLKPETPKSVTSWDVRTGRVIYWTADGDWSHDIAKAAVLTGEEAEAALAAARAQGTRAVDPYFMEAAPEGGVAGRETVRESIRAQGPTSHPELGRQAGNP